MPLHRRIPKRGFTNTFRTQYDIINIKDLQSFKSDDWVDRDLLVAQGLLHRAREVKLLGKGDISHPLRIKVKKASQVAKKKIESSGGKVEIG